MPATVTVKAGGADGVGLSESGGFRVEGLNVGVGVVNGVRGGCTVNSRFTTSASSPSQATANATAVISDAMSG